MCAARVPNESLLTYTHMTHTYVVCMCGTLQGTTVYLQYTILVQVPGYNISPFSTFNFQFPIIFINLPGTFMYLFQFQSSTTDEPALLFFWER